MNNMSINDYDYDYDYDNDYDYETFYCEIIVMRYNPTNIPRIII